jgi:hypothetical protein
VCNAALYQTGIKFLIEREFDRVISATQCVAEITQNPSPRAVASPIYTFTELRFT